MNHCKSGFYLCHSFSHRNHYDELMDILGLSFINYSTTACTALYKLHISFPTFYIKWRIKRRISKCALFIVILGDYFDESAWMQFEVAEAARREISILGVLPESFPPAQRRPKAIRYKEVGWKSGDIVRAVSTALEKK